MNDIDGSDQIQIDKKIIEKYKSLNKSSLNKENTDDRHSFKKSMTERRGKKVTINATNLVHINEGNFKNFYQIFEEIGFREFGKVLLVKHKITEVFRALKSIHNIKISNPKKIYYI